MDPTVLTACVGAQVQLLRALLAAIAGLDRADRRTGGHAAHRPDQPGPDPGRGRPILDRARDPEHAAAEAGASPVTKQSGKATSVHFRWAANTRARNALATYADNSRHASPWAATLYRQARQQDQVHDQDPSRSSLVRSLVLQPDGDGGPFRPGS